MTEPRRKRRRLPPGVERLLEEDELETLFPKDEFKNLPEDLTERAVYEMWSREDPYNLYRLQLRDYLYTARTGGKGGLAPGGIPKMTREQADALREQVEELIFYQFPVEELPFFKQVSRMKGPNWERAYFTYVDEEIQLDKKEEMNRKALYGGFQDPRGQAIRNAIESGTITEEEAQDLFTQRQWQEEQNARLLRPQDMSNKELIEAVRQGMLTNEEAFGSLAQTVDEFGNPMTYRQPGLGKWEERQREAARLANEQAQRGGRGNEDLIRTIRDAKAAGIDTSRYEEVAMAGSLPANTQGLYIKALGDQLAGLRKQRGEDWNLYMTKAYPQQFEEYMKGATPTSGITPGGFMSSFSQRPDFEQITAQREAKLWDEYGDIMPVYLKELSTKGYGQVEPIEKWLETDPFGQVFSQRRKERKAAQVEASRRRYAPLIRSF